MKKTKKILIIAAILLVVLLVAAAITISLSLNTIVKASVEKFGPQITKTDVKLEEISISLLSGSAKVKNLTIANPEGYTKTTNAISIGTADVGISPLSVFSSKIVIRKIHILAPEITFEGNPLSGNNLSQLLQNVNESSKSAAAKPAGTNATAKAAAGPAKKFQVDDLVLSGAKVHVFLTGTDKETAITIPDIHLTGLGRNPEGITGADLARNVISAISSATIKAVANDPSLLGKDVGNAAEKLKKGINSFLGK